jgi:probable phosphoglycerate mutase
MNGSSTGTDRRRIYLMRHAEAAYITEAGQRAPDSRLVPLTARGRTQAEAMRVALEAVTFDRALCTGLPRTVETAGIVLGNRTLALDEVPALEELKPGDIRQVPPEQLEATFLNAMSNAEGAETRFLGGERFADFEARIVPAFEATLAVPGWQSLLLVAHGGVNRMILGWACRAGRSIFPAFEQDPGCLNIIDVDFAGTVPARALIRAVNLTPYNWTKAGMTATTMEVLLRDVLTARQA